MLQSNLESGPLLGQDWNLRHALQAQVQTNVRRRQRRPSGLSNGAVKMDATKLTVPTPLNALLKNGGGFIETNYTQRLVIVTTPL